VFVQVARVRLAASMRRHRGRSCRALLPDRGGGGGGGGGGGAAIHRHSGNIPLNRNHVFDSSGPDLRVRGTAQQLFEKYLQLGRDATGSGDRVMAEGYFQHAEHYFRILNAINQATQQQHQNGQPNQNGQQQNGNAPNTQNQQRRLDGDYQGEDDDQLNGMGDQPTTELREIPISTAPSD
jgi:hypothetical protein